MLSNVTSKSDVSGIYLRKSLHLVSYFCKIILVLHILQVFEQCECVQIDNSSSSQHSERLQTRNKTSAHDVMSFLTWPGNATGGICNSNECLGLYKALPFFCIGFVFRTLLLTPLTMIILR